MGKNKIEKRQAARDNWNRNNQGAKPFCPVEGALTREAMQFCLDKDRKKTTAHLQMDFGTASRIATGATPPHARHHNLVRELATTMGWTPPKA